MSPDSLLDASCRSSHFAVMFIADLLTISPALVFITALLALALDVVFGDPDGVYRRVPHPVVLIGRLISFGERRLNAGGRVRRIVFGGGWSLLVVVLAGAVGGGVVRLLSLLFPDQGGMFLLFQALLASSLLACRGLGSAVGQVAVGLEQGLAQGRTAVGHLVGRDPGSLDDAGVARAAIESLAENYSDAVVAPLFWFVLLGLPGLCAYKAINTLDSMIGHRNERFDAFGKGAARLDDVVNVVPARLAGLFYVLAALVIPFASVRGAAVVMWRDAGKHRSPNAGWQEAPVAGALNISLAGVRHYGGLVVNDPPIGTGTALLGPADIRRALWLYRAACLWLAVVLLGCGVVFWELDCSRLGV